MKGKQLTSQGNDILNTFWQNEGEKCSRKARQVDPNPNFGKRKLNQWGQ